MQARFSSPNQFFAQLQKSQFSKKRKARQTSHLSSEGEALWADSIFKVFFLLNDTKYFIEEEKSSPKSTYWQMDQFKTLTQIFHWKKDIEIWI